MGLDGLETRGDLQRFIEELLRGPTPLLGVTAMATLPTGARAGSVVLWTPDSSGFEDAPAWLMRSTGDGWWDYIGGAPGRRAVADRSVGNLGYVWTTQTSWTAYTAPYQGTWRCDFRGNCYSGGGSVEFGWRLLAGANSGNTNQGNTSAANYRMVFAFLSEVDTASASVTIEGQVISAGTSEYRSCVSWWYPLEVYTG